MLIAGCLNQSKRIIQKFDEILYGSPPESLVVETHKAIRLLLQSEEAHSFLSEAREAGEQAAPGSDKFIKRIVEAVSPILPITLRDKSLDGTYLREALHMLGAVEWLFSQYQTDVREHSNPAGFVGLTAAMHNEFESAAIDSCKLRPLEDFMKDMKSVYQTALGLGTSFSKDSFPGTRRRRSGRGRSYWRNRRFSSQGVTRAQSNQQGFDGRAYQAPQFNGSQPVIPGSGIGRGARMPPRRGDECYGYQEGTCRRGAACRFRHVDN